MSDAMSITALPEDFDAWTQPFTLYYEDGRNITTTMADVNEHLLYGIRMGIHHGSGLGASLMFLVVLVLLTKADKRKAFIFNLNALCLLINIIRCLLLAMFLTSSLYHPYPELSGDYSRIKFGDQATNAATSILGLVLSLLVLLSLSVQVWIVSVTTAPYQRYILMGTTTTVACVAIGFRAAYVYYHVQGLFADVTPPLGLPGAMFTLQAVAIWLYSCIFAYKLGYAIIRRRRLNMPQFGPMQIVFIMGCQTMIIPAILSTLQFCEGFSGFATHVPTVICIFLPLSSVWAGVSNDAKIAAKGPDSHQRLIHGEFYRSGASSTISDGTTVCDKSRQMSMCTYTKSKDVESGADILSLPTSSNNTIGSAGIRVDHDFILSRENARDQV